MSIREALSLFMSQNQEVISSLDGSTGEPGTMRKGRNEEGSYRVSELVPHSCLPPLWDSISTSFIPSYTVSNVCFKNEGQEEGDVLEPLKVYSQDADVFLQHNIDEKTTQSRRKNRRKWQLLRDC